MDQRLFQIQGLRPHRLTKRDLPDLARAVLAYLRNQADVSRYVAQNVPCIHFLGAGVNVLVRSDDWAKVVPFIKDDTFGPSVVMVSRDTELYARILHILESLIP